MPEENEISATASHRSHAANAPTMFDTEHAFLSFAAEDVTMDLLPLDQLGPRELPGQHVKFGFLLPWVSASNGNRLFVKIIHEEDQFQKSIPPLRFELTQSILPDYGEFWTAEIGIRVEDRVTPSSAWGSTGRYVYRYELESPLLPAPLDWIVDPYAREYGIGRQSAFTLGYVDHTWGTVEQTWKTPALQDLIVYEIMVQEFSVDLKGATQKLPYLQDLGINCLEIMPIANVDRSIDWGFEPVGPFGLDERFGKRKDLQEFVEAAHQHGIAVILDMVYGHAGEYFSYEYVYKHLGYHENPFMGAFAKDMFGPSTDYNRKFTRDFFFTVNHYWLDRYHVDGIRYDCVPNYYDGFMGKGYSNLVYSAYKKIKSTSGADHWQRFFNNNSINLIQCAEQLEAPVEAVEKTYSNCTWQNGSLDSAKAVAAGNFGELYGLGMKWGLAGYPDEIDHNGDSILKSAFHYIENHDHSRFICCFGTDDLLTNMFREGRRENWYRVQPYAIGLMLSKGIPLLWQGQEILENYDVPSSGPARIGTLRPVRWERFYSSEGEKTIELYRKLIGLRNAEPVFRRGSYFFINNWPDHQSKGLILFERRFENQFALVALNFSASDHIIFHTFNDAGNYQERLHGIENLSDIAAGEARALTIPSNYGRVWIRQ